MVQSWFEYGKITSESLYNNLSKEEKEILDKFKRYMLISASEDRAEEGKREVLRFKEITGSDLSIINLDDLRTFLFELKRSGFGDHTKNKIKGFIHRFLKWKFRDWSVRFNEFEDLRLNGDAQNVKIIDDRVLFTSEDINKLLEAEKSLYWKTFLITQFEGGLRTKECRELKWDNIIFEDDGFAILNIPSKKNRNGTTKISSAYVERAGRYLKELKEQHNKKGIKSPYVFPSPSDPNKPQSKNANMWFNNLCKKTLGRPANNYLLRHSRGTELQEKVRRGELSKDNAVSFMRHSEKMFDKVYSHMSKDDIKKLIKNQIYNKKALTKEEKDEIKKLKEQIEELKKDKIKDIEFNNKIVKDINNLNKSLDKIEEWMEINKIPLLTKK